jgi:hypothetical protein
MQGQHFEKFQSPFQSVPAMLAHPGINQIHRRAQILALLQQRVTVLLQRQTIQPAQAGQVVLELQNTSC